MRGTRTGHLRWVGIALTVLWFSLLAGSSAWAITATDCSTCHGADVVEGHHDTTDPNSDYMQGNCEACHVGITTGNDCSACHKPAGYTFNSHHLPKSGQTTINCAQCHTGAGNPKDCSGCHKGEVPRNFHHTQLAAYRDAVTGKLNCTNCHPGAQLTSNCLSCHNEGSTVYRSKHHNYLSPSGSKPACTSCHTKLQQTSGNCQDCHAPRAKILQHHYAKDKTQPGEPRTILRDYCTLCHPNFPAASTPKEQRAGCQTCHATDNRELHHTTVMSSRNKICADCHTGIAPVTGCESCHTGDRAPKHHSSPAYLAGNCGACHTSSGLIRNDCNNTACHPNLVPTPASRHHNVDFFYKYPELLDRYGDVACLDCHEGTMSNLQPPLPENCIFCHEGIVKRTGLQAAHHGTQPAKDGTCATCHSGVSTAAGNCASCHGAGKIEPATSETHHAAAKSAGTACSNCHSGVSQPATCAVCHTGASTGTPSKRHHLLKDPQENLYECSICHSGSTLIYSKCQGCHNKAEVDGEVIVIETSVYHHMRPEYVQNLCATCHKTTDGSSLQKDCSYCHVGSDKPSTLTRHHETAVYLAGQCADCHENTAATVIKCAGCHPSTVTKHHSKTATVNDQIEPKPCKDCHSTIQLVGTSCDDAVGCHILPMAEFHHDTPLDSVGGNCGACHQSVNDPSVCGNCHDASPHHTTTWSQTGDCAHCHVVPAWAADRAPQAACRECHTGMSHTNGPGPDGIAVKNYGACAACHNQAPFHAAPTSNPGYTGYGAGKRKFNMFWSKFERRGDDFSPNGDDLGDEGGNRIKAQQLTFSTKSISHNGRSYTVPYFTGAAATNLALNKTATASGAESGNGAALAVDGNLSTRWWKKVSTTSTTRTYSSSTSAEWLKVDLGALKTINRVALRWGSYYATEYEIRVSTDNSRWTTVADANYGKGGLEQWNFSSRSVRYIQIYCQRASSSNGYAIYELEVYAP